MDWGELDAPSDDTPFESLTQEQQDIVLNTLGYIRYTGIVYYNPNAATDKLVTKLRQGPIPHYHNDDIQWGELDKPAPGTSFEDLTSEQKQRVVDTLGYQYDENANVYYKDSAVDQHRMITKTFIQGLPNHYNNEAVEWGDFGTPDPDAEFDDLTKDQQNFILRVLGYTKYEGEFFIILMRHLTCSSLII
jgi:hypothetical protein